MDGVLLRTIARVRLCSLTERNPDEYMYGCMCREETGLRAPNNYVLPIDDLVMTVAQWFQLYSRPEYRDTFIVLPKQTQRKGKNSKTCAFSVELYINAVQVRRTFQLVYFDRMSDRLPVCSPHRGPRDPWLRTNGCKA